MLYSTKNKKIKKPRQIKGMAPGMLVALLIPHTFILARIVYIVYVILSILLNVSMT